MTRRARGSRCPSTIAHTSATYEVQSIEYEELRTTGQSKMLSESCELPLGATLRSAYALRRMWPLPAPVGPAFSCDNTLIMNHCETAR